MTVSKAPLVPVFKLYGETAEWPTPDLIHCESIPERSQLHGWEIKPHRHADLLQLLYVQAGEAELEVEGQLRQVRSASLQVVPALCVHGFRFSSDVQGYVLSLARPLVEQLAAPLGQQCLHSPMCYEVGEQRRYLDALFESISQEYGRLEPARELMLQSLISVLLVAIARRQLARSEAQEPTDGRGREHVQAFVRLLEVHFREHLPIEHYASRLGISAAHLNALCRRLAGQSALQLINQRLLLEAKRCLVYTTMTVSQVSDSLGFSEPGYFSRFFKRGSGLSPKAFRLRR
ncbi:helix-turn-helix domain-containing protein [Ectopseudomonas alcaliphila]|uniref:AraC family transcriptional regulator, transcriptional activator of pobA n=1 Tax=Ectopseudomonas alcaliphila TaxID=101564 RepID=A0A1G7FWC0_9GAMM|nr:helix-turn-helix domain-containing protein [Pseudomonas alcaliphila]MDX5993982.1 helix-turn-helix domain-containing protein [Pseudomonas alcaliphila]SDE80203.1 AraC family transcriptional regulator, transcriptional activator of pobA [Pseudomonas alcaliphila]